MVIGGQRKCASRMTPLRVDAVAGGPWLCCWGGAILGVMVLGLLGSRGVDLATSRAVCLAAQYRHSPRHGLAALLVQHAVCPVQILLRFELCHSITQAAWHLISMIWPSKEHEAAITLRRMRSIALSIFALSAPAAGKHRGQGLQRWLSPAMHMLTNGNERPKKSSCDADVD